LPQADGGKNLVEYRLIGVFPASVSVYETDLWLPMWAPESALPRDRRQFQILARIRPGQTLAGVNVELAEIARRIEESNASSNPEYPEYKGWILEAATWHDAQRSRELSRTPPGE